VAQIIASSSIQLFFVPLVPQLAFYFFDEQCRDLGASSAM
jgi:hypothetical protein